jgi:hypothetical protein
MQGSKAARCGVTFPATQALHGMSYQALHPVYTHSEWVFEENKHHDQ